MTNKKPIKRNIIIGDVHGCLDELKSLIDLVGYSAETDSVLMLGDLVDRGPYSSEVIKFVRKMNFDCIRGNHEDKYIRYNKHVLQKIQNSNYKIPMNLSEDKKNIYNSLSMEDIFWLSSLPTFHEIKEHNFLAVHAGCLPNKGNPKYQNPQIHMYTRYIDKDTYKQKSLGPEFKQPENSIDWTEAYNEKYNIIYGHQVNSLEKVLIRTNSSGTRTIGIDTGCCFGGHLTAFCLITQEDNSVQEQIFQVKAKKAYTEYRAGLS